MIKIRIFCDWTNSFELSKIHMNYVEFHNDYDYGKTYIFVNDNSYTHVIIFNCSMVNLINIPKKNVIGIAHEPYKFLNLSNSFRNFAELNMIKYFISSKRNLPDPFIESRLYLFYHPPRKPLPIKKKNIISFSFSNKKRLPGHKYRHKLVKAILKSDLPIDMYGGGTNFYKDIRNRLHGSYRWADIEIVYQDYMFNIAIENSCDNYYFTEKIINPLLYNCIPVYLGAKEIDKYFPKMVIKLSGNINRDMQLLTNICTNPEKYRVPIDYEHVKREIYFMNFIKKEFNIPCSSKNV